MKQLDILDDDPRRLAAVQARAERTYAENWLRNPFYPVDECERRHAMHMFEHPHGAQSVTAQRTTG